MTPVDIEDTSDWLGCPTELETITHYKLVLENEVQELTQQLRKARENIFGLVQMHAEASNECAALRAELAELKVELSNASRRATDIETKSNWELMAKGKLVSHLYTRIHELTGDDPRAKLPQD
jgi:chromosome segregation ATPase